MENIIMSREEATKYEVVKSVSFLLSGPFAKCFKCGRPFVVGNTLVLRVADERENGSIEVQFFHHKEDVLCL